MNLGRPVVHVGSGRTSRHRLSRSSCTKCAAAVPGSARAPGGVYMRSSKADQSSYTAQIGRTGKKGRQTRVAGYCARCKSCLLFNKDTQFFAQCTLF